MRSHSNRSALLLVAHGTSKGTGGIIARRLLNELSSTGEVPCADVCYIMEDPKIPAALAELDNRNVDQIIVVPLLTCGGYLQNTVIPKLLFKTKTRAEVILTPPIGQHPRVPQLASDAAKTIIDREDLRMVDTTILIAGHGSARNPASSVASYDIAQSVGALLGCPTGCLFLSQLPFPSQWQEISKSRNTIVLPYFISGGSHLAVDLPNALSVGSSLHAENHSEPNRRHLWLAPAIGQHPRMKELILEQMQTCRKTDDICI